MRFLFSIIVVLQIDRRKSVVLFFLFWCVYIASLASFCIFIIPAKLFPQKILLPETSSFVKFALGRETKKIPFLLFPGRTFPHFLVNLSLLHPLSGNRGEEGGNEESLLLPAFLLSFLQRQRKVRNSSWNGQDCTPASFSFHSNALEQKRTYFFLHKTLGSPSF